jgi:hypothetical protein
MSRAGHTCVDRGLVQVVSSEGVRRVYFAAVSFPSAG